MKKFQKFVISVLAVLILFSSGGLAIKTSSAYKQNVYSELLLEDVDAQSWSFVWPIVDAIFAGIIVETFSCIINSKPNEKVPDSAKEKTFCWDGDQRNYQVMKDANGFRREYHTWYCQFVGQGMGSLSKCSNVSLHEIGDDCNKHM